MPSAEQTVRVYEDLAHWYDRQGQAKLRDWFLVLAADAALTSVGPDEAERLRSHLLQVNPHHLLRPFASFADALRSADVQGYVADLRRTYPPETAAQMLAQRRGEGGAAQREEPTRSFTAAATTEPQEIAEEPEVQVYRMQAPAEEPPAEPLPRQAPPPRPAPRPSPPLSSAPAPKPTLPRPTPVPPAPRPVAAQPSPWATLPTRPALKDEPEGGGDATRWVPTLLFALLLLGSLGLLGYLVARPFVPGLGP
jgi:hypothetical protein